MASLVEYIAGRGESAILVCDHIFTVDLLKQGFAGKVVYEKTGRVSETPLEYPCLLVMTSAAAESLNLPKFNHVIFYSVPFSVGAFIQSVGRIARMDSEYIDDLHVYIPHCEETIDKYKTALIEYNADVIKRLLGSEANLPNTVSNYTRRMIIKLRKELLWKTQNV